MQRLSRRQLLGLWPAVLAKDALAFGDSSRFVPALATWGPKWDARSSGLRRLAWELQRRTSVEVSLEARPVALTGPKLFEHPFLYLGGEGELPPLKPDEIETLRRYLTFGGFLLADAADASDGSGFDQSFRREMARVLPSARPGQLPSNHVVFKSFFMLEAAPGRVLNKPGLDAWLIGSRAAVLYSQNDLLGALARDESGGLLYDVTPGGERQRELATRLAINIVMYAMCLDYKDDAVHLPLILKRRK